MNFRGWGLQGPEVNPEFVRERSGNGEDCAWRAGPIRYNEKCP